MFVAISASVHWMSSNVCNPRYLIGCSGIQSLLSSVNLLAKLLLHIFEISAFEVIRYCGY